MIEHVLRLALHSKVAVYTPRGELGGLIVRGFLYLASEYKVVEGNLVVSFSVDDIDRILVENNELLISLRRPNDPTT